MVDAAMLTAVVGVVSFLLRSQQPIPCRYSVFLLSILTRSHPSPLIPCHRSSPDSTRFLWCAVVNTVRCSTPLQAGIVSLLLRLQHPIPCPVPSFPIKSSPLCSTLILPCSLPGQRSLVVDAIARFIGGAGGEGGKWGRGD